MRNWSRLGETDLSIFNVLSPIHGIKCFPRSIIIALSSSRNNLQLYPNTNSSCGCSSFFLRRMPESTIHPWLVVDAIFQHQRHQLLRFAFMSSSDNIENVRMRGYAEMIMDIFPCTVSQKSLETLVPSIIHCIRRRSATVLMREH